MLLRWLWLKLFGESAVIPTPNSGRRLAFKTLGGSVALVSVGPDGQEVVHGGGGAADGSVTNAKLANMEQARLKGRAAGAGIGAPVDLTPAQAREAIGAAIEPLGYVEVTNAASMTLDNIFDASKYSHYLITGFALPATNNVTFAPVLRNATPADVSAPVVAGGTMTRLDSTSATFDSGQSTLAGAVANASHGGVTFTMELILSSSVYHRFFLQTQSTQNGTLGNGLNIQGRTYLGWFADSTPRQGIKFAFSSGNIASGWINVEGVRK